MALSTAFNKKMQPFVDTDRLRHAMTMANIATPSSTPTSRPVTTATGKPINASASSSSLSLINYVLFVYLFHDTMHIHR